MIVTKVVVVVGMCSFDQTCYCMYRLTFDVFDACMLVSGRLVVQLLLVDFLSEAHDAFASVRGIHVAS